MQLWTQLLEWTALAALALFLYGLLWRDLYAGGAGRFVIRLLQYMAILSISLGLFNLIPIPPLDGSKLISPLLKGESRRIYNMLQAYSLPILMIVLYVVPTVFRVDPLGWYFDLTVDNVYDLLTFWW